MGHVASATISISNHGVGRAQVDPATIRGEGDAHDARLVVPVSLEMHPQPAEEQLALIRLSGSLHTDQMAAPQSRIGLPDSCDLIYNVPIRSVPQGSMPHTIEFRFPLSTRVIEKLEKQRHAAPDREAALYLHLEPILAWLHTAPGNVAVISTPEEETGRNLAARFALHSEMSIFWLPRIDPLLLAVDTSQWVGNVLPGLGYDRVRLIEVVLPPSLPPMANAGARFDALRRALDSRRYVDAVAASRDILSAWSSYLGANKQKPVATIVGQRLGWPEGDRRYALLDSLWKALTDLANVPHHPEGQVLAFEPLAADARLQLLLIVAVSEYLSEVLDVD